MSVFEAKFNQDGRLYIPGNVRDKMHPELTGVNVNSVILIVKADMPPDVIRECFKLMMDELELERKIKNSS